ncbi:hypothetical protein J6590_089742 [Homalodisca vitripennis]|nr:hypothetical protein J6590_089742 [Homalodisca vitripennis]
MIVVNTNVWFGVVLHTAQYERIGCGCPDTSSHFRPPSGHFWSGLTSLIRCGLDTCGAPELADIKSLDIATPNDAARVRLVVWKA